MSFPSLLFSLFPFHSSSRAQLRNQVYRLDRDRWHSILCMRHCNKVNKQQQPTRTTNPLLSLYIPFPLWLSILHFIFSQFSGSKSCLFWVLLSIHFILSICACLCVLYGRVTTFPHVRLWHRDLLLAWSTDQRPLSCYVFPFIHSSL